MGSKRPALGGVQRPSLWPGFGSDRKLRRLIEQYPPLFLTRRRTAAQFLAEIDPTLHRRPLFDRLAPTRDVGEFLQSLTQRLRDQHPGKRSHIGDRILVENILASFQPSFQHAQAAVVLVGIALMRIVMLALRIID